jgi:hypothetical protein
MLIPTFPAARPLLAGLFLAVTLPGLAETPPPDYRYKFEVLAEGLPQPMMMQ